MRHRDAVLAVGVFVLAAPACRPRHAQASSVSDSAELTARGQRFAERLSSADADGARDKPLGRWILPSGLREISGLALTDDGRLLTHGDNAGRITVIDPRRGKILSRFAVGDIEVKDDFEGITVANGTIYLLSSTGVLYQFDEGKDGAHVPYSMRDTRLGDQCEFEGVAYDRRSESLLLACKIVHDKALHDQLVIYRWKLQGPDASRLSTMTIPMSVAIGSNPWKTLHPSDITVDPSTGHYVLIASKQQALIEITPSGEVVRSVPLPGDHAQAEGVAITPDSVLIVSDEASNHSPAAITLYRWPPTGTAAVRP